MRGDGGVRVAWLAWAVAFAAGACGGGTQSPDGASADTASPGMCSADVPPGQACNTLANVATLITPTCVTGMMPVGTGGTIIDGTYTLTSQTYYQDTACSVVPLSETIAIAGECVQIVFGGLFSGTLSATQTPQGNTFTSAQTCQHLDVDAAVSPNPQMKTYTATPTTFTIFSASTTAGRSDVAVFTRR